MRTLSQASVRSTTFWRHHSSQPTTPTTSQQHQPHGLDLPKPHATTSPMCTWSTCDHVTDPPIRMRSQWSSRHCSLVSPSPLLTFLLEKESSVRKTRIDLSVTRKCRLKQIRDRTTSGTWHLLKCGFKKYSHATLIPALRSKLHCCGL